MDCKFLAEDIEHFYPSERDISGRELIERWDKRLGVDPRRYIKSKIMESRLMAFHPMSGLTEVSNIRRGPLPPLETGLFAQSEIKRIEATEFGNDGVEENSVSQSSTPVKAWKIIQHFDVMTDPEENERWWRLRMSEAKRYNLQDCRHSKGQPGIQDSSTWYPDQIASWLIDKKHMNKKKAVGVLRKHFPDCADSADQLDLI